MTLKAGIATSTHPSPIRAAEEVVAKAKAEAGIVRPDFVILYATVAYPQEALVRAVYAAAGGATEVVTADLSKTYLNWAERNSQLNGFSDATKYQFIHADVLQYLKGLPADGFDIIVMDPPTFSNSKRMEDFLDIQRDHAGMINDCLRAMKKGGMLVFSTNSRKFVLEKEKIVTATIKDITRATTPFDFEGKLFRWCYSIIK